MPAFTPAPRVTAFALQFLVDNLSRSIAYYEKIGFIFGEPWDRFYVVGRINGFELHLKETPKKASERKFRRDQEHLDAAAGVDGIETFYAFCVTNGATVIKALAATTWGTKDFTILISIVAVVVGFVVARVLVMVIETVSSHWFYPHLARSAGQGTVREPLVRLLTAAPLPALLVVIVGWIAARLSGRGSGAQALAVGALVCAVGVMNNLTRLPPVGLDSQTRGVAGRGLARRRAGERTHK